ncbi:unnamed protein product, partial [marine sediment metagenome]
MTEWCAYGLADEYSMFLGGDLNPNITFPNTNTILFENSTGSGDYVKLIYYDNGTLETAELFTYMGGTYPEGMSYNYTRIFDFNPIDEIEWNVEVGDEFYFGFRHYEYKYIVTGILNHSGYGMSGITTLQSVLANVYIWDFLTETWVLESENTSIATANEDLPYYGYTNQFLVPNGTTGNDIAALFEQAILMYPPDIELEYGEDYIKL